MPKRGAALIGLGGAVAVGSIAVVIVGSGSFRSEVSSPPTPRFTQSAMPRPSVSQPEQIRESQNDNDLDRALRVSEQTNLDPGTERSLLMLAEAALRADLTGIGRERFPGYLPGQPPARVYRDVRIQAGVAYRIDDTTADAHLLWTATSPRGGRVERHTAIIRLKCTDHSWTPQPPGQR